MISEIIKFLISVVSLDLGLGGGGGGGWGEAIAITMNVPTCISQLAA